MQMQDITELKIRLLVHIALLDVLTIWECIERQQGIILHLLEQFKETAFLNNEFKSGEFSPLFLFGFITRVGDGVRENYIFAETADL